MIRLVIIEDEDLIRLGIKTAINQEQNMEVVGEAATGNEGVQLVEELQPDIVLVDIALPDISGLEIIHQIKSKTSSKVIVLTSHSSQDIVNSALENGADSYVLKKTDIELIKHAIKSTYENNSFIDSDISKRVFENFFLKKSKIKGKIYRDSLTATEMKILSLMALGLSNKEIADRMFITTSTVKGHSSSLFSKLGARDRVNAIIIGKQLGYIESDVKVS